MKGRFKWSLSVGLAFSLSLEIVSAIVTASHPTFRDHPEIPHPIFLLLQFPGWVSTGGPPFQLWVEAIAVVINGIFYGAVIFGVLAILNLRAEGTPRRHNPTAGVFSPIRK
jgi:hypothetical protein